ncbi:hypothetical protein CGCTS75_v014619 [Colletotrichum tropicale]|nr:hypothetical protein CGCTS75_v014619 [Colletotrichum tropicale]
MFPTIVLVAFFATVTNAKGACYVPNGIDRHSLSNIGDNEYDPCEKDGVSMCCNTHNKDRCQRSGLCWEPSSNVLWRGSCTDQTWESPGCLKLCISPNETGIDQLPMNEMDQAVTGCNDGEGDEQTYCCGYYEQARSCCEAGLGMRIVNGQVVAKTSGTTTSATTTSESTTSATTAPTQTPSASTSAADSGNASSNAGIIGGAVGGSVAAVMVLGLTWFIWLRRRKAAKSSGASNMANMVELNSGERKELYSQRMPPGYSRQPSELPTTAPLIELGGGNSPPGAAR